MTEVKKHKSSIGATLSLGIAKVGRMATANILFALITFWPIALIISLPIILMASGSAVGSSPALLPILMLAAMVWACIASIRFALVPYVALFEPDVPIVKALGRSKYLLLKGGQWFLVKGFLLLLLVFTILSLATHQNFSELMNSNSIAVNILLILLSVMTNGALVMLYLNRRVIKSSGQD